MNSEDDWLDKLQEEEMSHKSLFDIICDWFHNYGNYISIFFTIFVFIYAIFNLVKEIFLV